MSTIFINGNEINLNGFNYIDQTYITAFDLVLVRSQTFTYKLADSKENKPRYRVEIEEEKDGALNTIYFPVTDASAEILKHLGAVNVTDRTDNKNGDKGIFTVDYRVNTQFTITDYQVAALLAWKHSGSKIVRISKKDESQTSFEFYLIMEEFGDSMISIQNAVEKIPELYKDYLEIIRDHLDYVVNTQRVHTVEGLEKIRNMYGLPNTWDPIDLFDFVFKWTWVLESQTYKEKMMIKRDDLL